MGEGKPVDVATETKGGDVTKAKETVNEIEKIDTKAVTGAEFVHQVNDILKTGGLTGDDATSQMVIQELERRKMLPNFMVAGLADKDDKAAFTIGENGQFTRDRLQKVADGEATGFGTKPDEASRLLSNALLQRFSAVEDADYIFHTGRNSGNPDLNRRNGAVNANDIRTYAGDQIDPNKNKSADQLDEKKRELRPDVNQVLHTWDSIQAADVSKLPDGHILRKIHDNQPLSQRDIERALDRDEGLSVAMTSSKATDAEKAAAGVLTPEQRKALEFVVQTDDKGVSRFDKVMNVDGNAKATALTNEQLDKYARVMGTSRENARNVYSGYEALDKPGAVNPEVKKLDPKTVDATALKAVTDKIAGIDTNTVQGQELLKQVNAAMRDKGLDGTDATSKAVIAELEKQGKLQNLIAAGFGSRDALGAFDAEYSGGYTKEKLQQIAAGTANDRNGYGRQSDEASKLIATAMLDKFDGISDVHEIRNNKDRKDPNRGYISLDDIKDYASIKPEDRRTAESALRTTNGDAKDTDPDFIKKIKAGQPVNLHDLERAQDKDSNAQVIAGNPKLSNDLTEADKQKMGLLTEEQRNTLNYLVNNYKDITSLQKDAPGVNKDLIERHASAQGTNREIASRTSDSTAAKQPEAEDPNKAALDKENLGNAKATGLIDRISSSVSEDMVKGADGKITAESVDAAIAARRKELEAAALPGDGLEQPQDKRLDGLVMLKQQFNDISTDGKEITQADLDRYAKAHKRYEGPSGDGKDGAPGRNGTDLTFKFATKEELDKPAVPENTEGKLDKAGATALLQGITDNVKRSSIEGDITAENIQKRLDAIKTNYGDEGSDPAADPEYKALQSLKDHFKEVAGDKPKIEDADLAKLATDNGTEFKGFKPEAAPAENQVEFLEKPHVVGKYDTIEKLSRKYGVSIQDIYNDNKELWDTRFAGKPQFQKYMSPPAAYDFLLDGWKLKIRKPKATT